MAMGETTRQMPSIGFIVALAIAGFFYLVVMTNVGDSRNVNTRKVAQANDQHQIELERFQKAVAAAPLWSWAEFFAQDGRFDALAMAAVNKRPNLQADAEGTLHRGIGFPLAEYRLLNITATPSFCAAAGEFLTREAVAHRASGGDANYQTARANFEPYDGAIEWLTTHHCDLDAAVAAIRDAVGRDAPSSARDSFLTVLAWRRGNGFFKRGDPGLALAEYDTAVRLRPDDDQFHELRGAVYYDAHNYDNAIADYDEAVRINPGYWDAYNDRGTAYLAKGDEERALQDYGTAIEKNPQFALAYSNRAGVFVHQGDLARAIADFDRALMIAPKYRAALAGRGRAKFYAGSYSEAVTDFAGVLGLNPSDSYTVLWLYLAGIRAGQDARAALAVDAAKLDRAAWPYPIVAALLGETTQQAVLDGIGRPDNSARDAEQCEADFYFGETAVGDGNTVIARPLLRRAAQICPDGYIERTGTVYEFARLPD
jgi:lipoprotein NlpI